MMIECRLITYFVAALVGTVEMATQAAGGDPCDPNPCIEGRDCTSRVNSYECTCKIGYSGADCSTNINECASNPCQNGGTCIDDVNGYTCSCVSGYKSVHCEDMDECASNPCLNGGKCTEEEDNGYTCSCKPGYSGTYCDIDIDECASNPCKNETCSDRVDGYECGKNGNGTKNNGQVIMMPTTKVLLLTLVSKIIWML